MEWHENDGVRWLQADLGRGRAAFASRLGGTSEGPFESLNLGSLTDDEPDRVAENRRRLAAALGRERIAYARQVHGAELVDHGAAATETSLRCSFSADGAEHEQRSRSSAEPPEADGHVLRDPAEGVALVFVADCLPVALAGPDGAAILHCGWRGLAAGIVARGAAAVAATDAAVGPGIGPCCYRVGEEVLGAFATLGGEVASGRMLDLPAIARRQLEAAGVERVETAGLCTSCESELFFSHRRDAGRTGRQAGLAWLAEGDGETRCRA